MDEKIYELTVEGQYITADGKAKNYSIKVKLPSLEAALSVIKNKLLDKTLRKKYQDYSTFRTHEIVETIIIGDGNSKKELSISGKNIKFMNRKQLLKYIKDNKLPVNENYYKTAAELKIAIGRAEEDPDAFVEAEKAKEKDRMLEKKLEELNG